MSRGPVFDAAAKVLGKVTGLSPARLRTMWDEVRSNQVVLESCPGPHEFTRIGDTLPATFRCLVCGGDADSAAVHWYNVGLEHARRSISTP